MAGYGYGYGPPGYPCAPPGYPPQPQQPPSMPQPPQPHIGFIVDDTIPAMPPALAYPMPNVPLPQPFYSTPLSAPPPTYVSYSSPAINYGQQPHLQFISAPPPVYTVQPDPNVLLSPSRNHNNNDDESEGSSRDDRRKKKRRKSKRNSSRQNAAQPQLHESVLCKSENSDNSEVQHKSAQEDKSNQPSMKPEENNFEVVEADSVQDSSVKSCVATKSSVKPQKIVAAKSRYQGTVKASTNFNVTSDCEVLRKAMKKTFATDKSKMIQILTNRNLEQRLKIREHYKQMYGESFVKELRKSLGFNLRRLIVALVQTRGEFDSHQIRKAVKGLGTNEWALIEILCTRTNGEIKQIKANYKFIFNREVETDVKDDTSGHFRRLLMSMLQASRDESEVIDVEKAKRSAQKLYNAGEKKWGTDEHVFNSIIASDNTRQLAAIFAEYGKISKRSMEQAIVSEFSGSIRNGLNTIVKCVINRPAYFAERLYKSMKGLGTDDNTLIRLVVTRSEIDMVQIKDEFLKNYKKTLESFIKDDTSGSYREALLQLVK